MHCVCDFLIYMCVCPLCHHIAQYHRSYVLIQPEDRMLKQLPDMLNELEYLAVAMKNQREFVASADAEASK
jgi:hypothetical protein